MALEMENFSFSTDLTQVWDDNQSQARFVRDQVEDQSTIAGVAGGYDFNLSSHALLSAGLFVEAEKMKDITPLDRTTVGVKGTYRWQPSSAFTAPIVEFNASWQQDDFKDDPRDSAVTIVQAFITRRFTDRITATGGIQYRQRGSEGSVWDTEDARLFLNADYSVGSRATVYLTYSYIDGDTTSSAQRVFCNGNFAVDLLPLINVSTARERDEAYNTALCGEWIAYRLDAQTHAFMGGLNYGLSHNLSVDVSMLMVDVTAKDDDDVFYERSLVRASLLTRF